MSHLGERVSALIDGELGHSERERALAHLTFCADCRAEVDAFRALKARLRAMESPGMPVDVTMALLRMSEPGDPLPPRPRPLPGMYGVNGVSSVNGSNGVNGVNGSNRPFGGSVFVTGPADNRPRGSGASTGPGRMSRVRRAGYVAVGVASAAVALGTFLITSGPETRPPTAPGMMVPPLNSATYGRTTPTPSPSVSKAR
ncbi:zf-HC2 domain-containing protein [Streptosporangiaceae bacterium NEAU-GS5]|nr:zf-HC2 domain-containing protein [Streptosporangiaceae bacterium NEAU-GS5]